MVLLSLFFLKIDWSLPLKNPVLIFSLILFIILFAPIILNKFKIPHLIGLIIAGAIIGPNALNLLKRDSSVILFGTVGLLYIMFLAGLEIDLNEFKKNSKKSLIFGMYTFLIPMVLGTLAGAYWLQFPLDSSILLASMFASHTLIAYPIVSKLGIAKSRAVNVAVGGTMITDTLALLVLAVISGMATGEVNNEFWIRLIVSVIIFAGIGLFIFPIIGRWFFKRFDDNISQYIFVLGMVFLSGFLAEVAGLESIIGAFLAGLALNRLIPHTSALMNRIEFVGNALFIPFFLIGVGMMIDYKAFFKDWETIKVALTMVVIANVAKYLAAWAAQKTFGYNIDERRVIFGLSNAQAAATLAAILVAYNIILNQAEIDAAALQNIKIEPIRLLDESVLNGAILMILITCTIASFQAQKGGQNIALLEKNEEATNENSNDERILIPINNLEATEELINLSIMVKSKNNKHGLYALTVIDQNSPDNISDKKAKKILEKALTTAAASDNHLHELLRYDLNIINGITNVVRENQITDLIVGLTRKKGISSNFLGNLTEGILTKCNTTTLIYKSAQPLATIKRHLIIVPEKAEKEIGFPFWLIKIWNIARNTGAKLCFYATKETISYIRDIQKMNPVECEFSEFEEWDDFLILARDVQIDDNLIIVLSRKDGRSYQDNMAKVPIYLNKYFQKNSFILVYPMQMGVAEHYNMSFKNPSILEPIEQINEISKNILNLFRRK